MKKRSRVPVVLLGGLNVVRALGLAGIPAIIASSDRRTPAMASRYCRGTIPLPPLSDRDAVAEVLARFGRRLAEAHGARVPLFCDNDDRLMLVQDYRERLAPHYALPLNRPAIGEALLDKALFQSLAERRGLPVPRRIAWEALDAERGPVLVKPKLRTAWERSSIRRDLFGGAGKARIFPNGRAVRADELARSLAPQLAFQEYVPGGDDAIWSFHGFATPEGEVLASFVGRKIRTFPSLTGESTYLRLAHDAGLAALGREIAARLPLAGVFKMDFKRHSGTGRFHLLEINPRVNLWCYLGAVAGVNLPRVAYDFLVEGRRPAERQADLRYRWLSLKIDWLAYKELRARGALTLGSWLASLLEAPKVYDLFSWTDPAPFARYWSARFGMKLGRLWHSTAS